MKLFGTGDINFFTRRYFQSLDNLAGKIVIDIPAGSGYMSEVIRNKGGIVEAYDLFPEFFKVEGLKCQKVDLSEILPIADDHADYVLCQEGIEHIPDQFNLFREFNRILKPEGKLILTTPNISHLRAKLSNFLIESDLYNRFLLNELDSVWYSKKPQQKLYFGHIFLIGIQKMRILSKLSGFKIIKIHPVKASNTSLLLGLLFPLILLCNVYAYYASMRRHKDIDSKWRKSIFKEILKLNLNPNVLFGKHLFVEFQKVYRLDEVGSLFYNKLNRR